MTDTKERILMAALHLFARDGYEAVSVSAIAGELGMTKGALYKHFAGKRDILERIVQRMTEMDAQRAQESDVPEHLYADSPQEYTRMSAQQVRGFTLGQFDFFTADEFGADFRRMLTLEQFRSEEMQRLYSDCVATGPVHYVKDIFAQMMQEGSLKLDNPMLLALEYYAPFFLLLQAADASHDAQAATALLTAHIDSFFARYGCHTAL